LDDFMDDGAKFEPAGLAGFANSVLDSQFPNEPFPCPSCGQFLAPTVRLCVACKQPIDPAAIKRPQAVLESPAVLPATQGVPFPWPLFSVLLLVRVLTATVAYQKWGLAKAELVMSALELLTGVWVFFDAKRQSVSRPLRWALGSLLLWIVVFPWYLARRKSPRATCQFVEGPALVLTLLLCFLLGIAVVALKGPPAW
jgi:hypothetical protein